MSSEDMRIYYTEIVSELVALLFQNTPIPVNLVLKVFNARSTFRDVWFENKFSRLCHGGDLTDEERARFCAQLEDENREENGHRILYIVDQIETDAKMDFIINATHSFSSARSHISKSMYFRICNIIVGTLDEDLIFLKKNIDNGEMPYSEEVQGLMNHGLMRICDLGIVGEMDNPDEDTSKYEFTQLATLVDKYALSYNSCDRYPELYFETQEQ